MQQCNPCRVLKCIPIECSLFHTAWLNAVYFMQCEEKVHYWMQWILCSMIECSRFHAAWLMQWILYSMAQSIPIECRGFHALWRNGSRLYAVESMQWGPMHPDWMQWIICSMAQNIPIKCSGFHAAWWNEVYSIQCEVMEHYCRQWILCSMAQSIPIEYSGFHEASMNARIPCIVAQWILIVCSGVYAAWRNGTYWM